MNHLIMSALAIVVISLSSLGARAETKIKFVMPDSFDCKPVKCVSGACKSGKFGLNKRMRGRNLRSELSARFNQTDVGVEAYFENGMVGAEDSLRLDMGHGESHSGGGVVASAVDVTRFAQKKTKTFKATFDEWYEFYEANDQTVELLCGKI